MNVIFTGTTGVRKRKVLEALVSRRAQALQPAHSEIRSLDPDDPVVKRFVRRADVDRCWRGPEGEAADVEAVLADGEITKVRKEWREAFQRAAKEVGPARADRFLAVHASYFWSNRPSIPVDLGTVASFQPDAFVTLIDDCYSAWWRVKEKDRAARRGSYLRLHDVLRWRQFDMWIVQQLVNDLSSARQDRPPVPHYVLAVKHPVETLYRLLYEPSRLKVYGARPISSIRDDADCVAKIEENYQKPLREEFTLIEPATIDERPIQFAFANTLQDQGSHTFLPSTPVQLAREKRLPLTDPMVADDAAMFAGGVLELDASEAFQVGGLVDKDGRTEIDSQIQERDFWLIRMCNRVSGYRPYWAGITPYGARGVIAELNLGARLWKSPRYVGLEDDVPARDASPLDPKVGAVGSVEELLAALHADEEGLRQLLEKGGS